MLDKKIVGESEDWRVRSIVEKIQSWKLDLIFELANVTEDCYL